MGYNIYLGQNRADILQFKDGQGRLQKKNSKKSDIVTKGRQVGDLKPHFI